jgi:hypothetical protein
MVSEFVKHCDPDLRFELAARTARPFQRTGENDDSIGSHERVGGTAIGARDSLVESEQLAVVSNVSIVEVFGTWLFFYDYGDVVEQPPHILWKFTNDPGNKRMKPLLTCLAGYVPSRLNHA